MDKQTLATYPKVFPTYTEVSPSREQLAAMFIQAMLPAVVSEYGIGTAAELMIHRTVQLAYKIADETLLVSDEGA